MTIFTRCARSVGSFLLLFIILLLYIRCIIIISDVNRLTVMINRAEKAGKKRRLVCTHGPPGSRRRTASLRLRRRHRHRHRVRHSETVLRLSATGRTRVKLFSPSSPTPPPHRLVSPLRRRQSVLIYSLSIRSAHIIYK